MTVMKVMLVVLVITIKNKISGTKSETKQQPSGALHLLNVEMTTVKDQIMNQSEKQPTKKKGRMDKGASGCHQQ